MINFEEFEIPLNYELAHDKKYKQYEGKFDSSPKQGNRRTYCSDTRRYTMYERENFASQDQFLDYIQLEDSESDDDVFLTETTQETFADNGNQLSHRISVLEPWGTKNYKSENMTDIIGDDKQNPLEAGLLLGILFK